MKNDGLQIGSDGEYWTSREAVIKTAGEILANHFLSQTNPQLLLDMDGVVFRSDSLHIPLLTTPDIIQTLQLLEINGIMIGPATARGMHVVNYLREHGLQLSGPAILEDGQKLVQNGIVEYLNHQNHQQFMRNLRSTLMQSAEFSPSWDHVRKVNQDGRFAFCAGNFQWQGDSISSFWFHYIDGSQQDTEIISTKFEPVLRALALQHGLDYDHDVTVNSYRMQRSFENGNLGVVSIRGKLDGRIIDKGIAAEKLYGTWAFAADGFGDTPIAIVTKTRGGVVIGIEGNLDITNEVPYFLQIADVVLKTSNEFNDALRHAANILGKGRLS